MGVRRNDKEITDFDRIEDILRQAKVCRLGLNDRGRAYIVPLNFGYRDGVLYFHSADTGTKIEILRSDPNVCFELDVDLGIVPGESGCSWSTRYKSVIGFGKAAFVDGIEAKRDAIDILMSHYSDKKFDYPFETLGKTVVFKVEIESVTGKQSI